MSRFNEGLLKTGDRDDVDPIAELDDLLDGDRDRSLRMMCTEEILSPPAEGVVRQEWRLKTPGHPYARRIMSISSFSFWSETF
jgi:hypothetical protein